MVFTDNEGLRQSVWKMLIACENDPEHFQRPNRETDGHAEVCDSSLLWARRVITIFPLNWRVSQGIRTKQNCASCHQKAHIRKEEIIRPVIIIIHYRNYKKLLIPASLHTPTNQIYDDQRRSDVNRCFGNFKAILIIIIFISWVSEYLQRKQNKPPLIYHLLHHSLGEYSILTGCNMH